MTSPTIVLSSAKVAEARRLYREFHARCFWSYRRDLEITPEKVDWVLKRLEVHGGMEGFRAAKRLSEDS